MFVLEPWPYLWRGWRTQSAMWHRPATTDCIASIFKDIMGIFTCRFRTTSSYWLNSFTLLCNRLLCDRLFRLVLITWSSMLQHWTTGGKSVERKLYHHRCIVPQYTSSSIPTVRKCWQGWRWCTPFSPDPKSPSPRSCQTICTTAPSPVYTSSNRCSAVIW